MYYVALYFATHYTLKSRNINKTGFLNINILYSQKRVQQVILVGRMRTFRYFPKSNSTLRIYGTHETTIENLVSSRKRHSTNKFRNIVFFL